MKYFHALKLNESSFISQKSLKILDTFSHMHHPHQDKDHLTLINKSSAALLRIIHLIYV